MTQPVLQPWLTLPPRSRMVARWVSPPMASANSNVPAEKLLVGSPPASLRMLVSTLVPYMGSPVPDTPCSLMALLKRLVAATNASLSACSRKPAPLSETTMALSPLLPMTAPRPPRPANRLG